MPIIDDEFLSKLVREPVVVRLSEVRKGIRENRQAFGRARPLLARDLPDASSATAFPPTMHMPRSSAPRRAVSSMTPGMPKRSYARAFPRERAGPASKTNWLPRVSPSTDPRMARRVFSFRRAFGRRPRVRAAVQKTSSVEEYLRFRMSQTCFAGVFKRCGVRGGAPLRAGERWGFLTKRGRFSCSVGVLWGKLECIRIECSMLFDRNNRICMPLSFHALRSCQVFMPGFFLFPVHLYIILSEFECKKGEADADCHGLSP